MDIVKVLPDLIGGFAGGFLAIVGVFLAHRFGSKQVDINWMRDKTLESYLEFHREISDFLRNSMKLRRFIDSNLVVGPEARVEAFIACEDLRVISDKSADALERVLITSDDEFFLFLEERLFSCKDSIIRLCEDWARDESCEVSWGETPMQDGMALDELFERYVDDLAMESNLASVYFRDNYYPKRELVKPLRRYSQRVFSPGD